MIAPLENKNAVVARAVNQYKVSKLGKITGNANVPMSEQAATQYIGFARK
ncbi:hypothetical protein ACFOND_04920 [Reinekea marina]|uniref:Uncharacterized protein n=1 Tax=Reinekea marina TaxID=1310421 RepID=A0ABV7WPD3_9GAMM